VTTRRLSRIIIGWSAYLIVKEHHTKTWHKMVCSTINQ